MTIEKFLYENVTPDGVIDPGSPVRKGAVVTTGGIRMGKDYITIMLPRTSDGVVEVVKAQFESYRQLSEFLMRGELLIKPTNNDKDSN